MIALELMWLSQNQTPSYKTINRFRVNPKTDALIYPLFVQITNDQVLKDMPIGMINMDLREILNYMSAMIV